MYRNLKEAEEIKIGLTLDFSTQKINHNILADYKEELPETVQFTLAEYPGDDYDIIINCILERFDHLCSELRDELIKKLKGRLSNVNREL